MLIFLSYCYILLTENKPKTPNIFDEHVMENIDKVTGLIIGTNMFIHAGKKITTTKITFIITVILTIA